MPLHDQGQEFWGYQSSKKRYYYGLKLHLMVTKDALPVEFFLTPASFSDTKGLELFDFDLPEGSQVYGDPSLTLPHSRLQAFNFLLSNVIFYYFLVSL